MKTQYLLPLLFLLVITIGGCQKKVPKSEYDNLMSEYQELKSELGISQSTNIRNGKELAQILTDLSEISGNTVILRQDVESGAVRPKQIELISTNIDAVRKKVRELESRNNGNEAFQKTIQNLKVVIAEKEKEIASLKRIIADRDNQIKENKEVIRHQGDIITQKELALKQAVREQAALLYQAGTELEKLAQAAPDVSRKKNKKKMSIYRQKVLERARFYYRKAYDYGYDSAKNDVWRIERLLNNL